MCAEVPLSNQYKGIFIGKSHTISVNNEVDHYFNLVWREECLKLYYIHKYLLLIWSVGKYLHNKCLAAWVSSLYHQWVALLGCLKESDNNNVAPSSPALVTDSCDSLINILFSAVSYLNILWDCGSWYCVEAILLDYPHLIILISAATHISNI